MPQGQLTKQQRVNSAQGVRAYWAKMTPEERSAEMRRRQALTHSRLEARLQEGTRFSPTGRERIREAQRKRWREAKAKSQKKLATARHPTTTQSPFPSERVSISQRLAQLELQVNRILAELGLNWNLNQE
jgi:hypothetical protein